MLAAKVLIGLAAVGWLGAELADQIRATPAAEAPRLSVVGEPVPSYQAGHAQFGVNLRNDSQTSVVIDYAAILDDGEAPEGQLQAPSWAAAKVLPISAIPGQFSHDPVSRGVEIAGGGGSAVLEVTVDPPCGNAEPPSSAHVVVGWHTSSGETGETALPDVLSGPTSFPAVTQAACRAVRHVKPQVKPVGTLSPGDRYSPGVIGAQFSFRVPASGWEQFGDVSINKSTVPPRSAEAIIYWTTMGEGITDGRGVEACGQWWGSPAGSVHHYVASAAKASGIKVVSGPSAVTLDGYPAQHLVFAVRRHHSCDPGFFFRWPTVRTGASWTRTNVGDIVRIWLVDVGGTRVYFEAETREDAGRDIDREIQQIMRSVRFV